jgi:mannose-6-phosphate isomerase-like protein (cupin superfamily)
LRSKWSDPLLSKERPVLEAEAGSAVLIPFDAKHAIRNAGIEPLEYISATASPFSAEVRGATWEPG